MIVLDTHVAGPEHVPAAVAHDASLGLDEDRARLYVDLVLVSLSEAARRELQAMDPAKYEYQSEFARRYIALGRLEGKVEGKAEGKAEGKTDLLVRLLTARFGALPEDVLFQLRSAPIDELDAIGERMMAARTLEEALGGP